MEATWFVCMQFGEVKPSLVLVVLVFLEVYSLSHSRETESDGMNSRRVACGELTVGRMVGQAGDEQTAAWKLRVLCVRSLVR